MVQSEKEQSRDDYDVGVVREDMQMEPFCNWPRRFTNKRADILDKRHDRAGLKMPARDQSRGCKPLISTSENRRFHTLTLL